MTEIDTAFWRRQLETIGDNFATLPAGSLLALCDEIDRLRASLREAERLKEEAGLLYVSAIRDGDIARAKLDTAREKALEEAANLVDGVVNDPDFRACRAPTELLKRCDAISAGIRALASSGVEKGEANG